MSMTELIERASRVQRWRFDPAGLVLVRGDWYGIGLPGAVLMATIEAIETRGFIWELERDADRDMIAVVQSRDSDDKPGVVAKPDLTPEEALLTAFLAALESA